MTLSVVIRGLTLEELEEILRLVREIEQRDSNKLILCSISGLEEKSIAEAKKILREIFPARGVAA